MTITHRFSESLDLSHKYANASWWQEIYQQAFPGSIMQDMRADGWWQRAGIDRLIHCADATTVAIDEKVRRKDWPDFALEVRHYPHWPDYSGSWPGWMEIAQACDYYAYAFIPSQTCYLLPRRELKRVWEANKTDWAWLAAYEQDGFMYRNSPNEDYISRSLCVPRLVLLNKIRDALLFTWGDG